MARQVEKVKVVKLSNAFESVLTSAIINCSPSACNPLGVCLTTKLTSSPSNQLDRKGCIWYATASSVVMIEVIVAKNSVRKLRCSVKDHGDGNLNCEADLPIATSRLPSLMLNNICSSLRKSCMTPKTSLIDTIIPNMSFGRPI